MRLLHCWTGPVNTSQKYFTFDIRFIVQPNSFTLTVLGYTIVDVLSLHLQRIVFFVFVRLCFWSNLAVSVYWAKNVLSNLNLVDIWLLQILRTE